MNKAEAEALWAAVKANRKAIDECPGPHDFVGIESELQTVTQDGGKLYRKYKCTQCGGEVTTHDWYWYQHGLKHGKAIANG